MGPDVGPSSLLPRGPTTRAKGGRDRLGVVLEARGGVEAGGVSGGAGGGGQFSSRSPETLLLLPQGPSVPAAGSPMPVRCSGVTWVRVPREALVPFFSPRWPPRVGRGLARSQSVCRSSLHQVPWEGVRQRRPPSVRVCARLCTVGTAGDAGRGPLRHEDSRNGPWRAEGGS